MYARSTTVEARPDSVDAGLDHIRAHVLPSVPDVAGCTGLSLLVDRTFHRCILTTAWRSEEALHAGDGRMRRHEERVAALLGGRPETEEWEIAVLHRDHAAPPGACVRAVRLRVEPDEVDRGVDLYRMVLLPQIREFPEFCSASLLVDRPSGHAVSSVAFGSRAAMRRTRTLAAVVRERGAREATGEVLEVGEFDLAIARLSVPELV